MGPGGGSISSSVHGRRQAGVLNQALAGFRGGRYGSKRDNVEANIGDDDYDLASELMELDDDDDFDDGYGDSATSGGGGAGSSSGPGAGSNRGGKRTSRRKL